MAARTNPVHAHAIAALRPAPGNADGVVLPEVEVVQQRQHPLLSSLMMYERRVTIDTMLVAEPVWMVPMIRHWIWLCVRSRRSRDMTGADVLVPLNPLLILCNFQIRATAIEMS